jgi:hypothetical protein
LKSLGVVALQTWISMIFLRSDTNARSPLLCHPRSPDKNEIEEMFRDFFEECQARTIEHRVASEGFGPDYRSNMDRIERLASVLN